MKTTTVHVGEPLASILKSVPREVNVIGLGPSQPEKYEGYLMSINNAHDHLGFKPNLIIAMDDLKRDAGIHPEYVDSIVNAGCPVLTCTAYPEWPNTIDYPLDLVIPDENWQWSSKILNNTINYALALLARLEVNKIGCYGFDFVRPDDPKTKPDLKPGEPDWFVYYKKPWIRTPEEPGLEYCMYLIGCLLTRGVDVHWPGNGTFFDMDRPCFFYGYQEQPYE